MPRASQEIPATLLLRPAAAPVAPSVSTEELDGPLCALSLYLSTVEVALRATDIDRDVLTRALQGAKEEVAALAQRIDAACQAVAAIPGGDLEA